MHWRKEGACLPYLLHIHIWDINISSSNALFFVACLAVTLLIFFRSLSIYVCELWNDDDVLGFGMIWMIWGSRLKLHQSVPYISVMFVCILSWGYIATALLIYLYPLHLLPPFSSYKMIGYITATACITTKFIRKDCVFVFP